MKHDDIQRGLIAERNEKTKKSESHLLGKPLANDSFFGSFRFFRPFPGTPILISIAKETAQIHWCGLQRILATMGLGPIER